MRKLQGSRRFYTFVYAEAVSWDQCPYRDYLKVLDRAACEWPMVGDWKARLHSAEATLADY